MGAGRSGSTILGILLGNCPGVFFAGELCEWALRGGVPPIDRPLVSAFWRRVSGLVAPPASNWSDEVRMTIEHSSRIFKPWRWRRAQNLVGAYRELNVALCHAIAKEANTRILVDSSHYPLRARELRRAGNLEVVVVWLVRQPSSVVDSFQVRGVGNKKSPIAANVYLMVTGVVSAFVYLTHEPAKRLLMSYEEVLESPIDALTTILERVDRGAPKSLDLRHLTPTCAFAGNRVLGQQTISLQSSSAGSTRPLTRLVQSPLIIFQAIVKRRAQREVPATWKKSQRDRARQNLSALRK